MKFRIPDFVLVVIAVIAIAKTGDWRRAIAEFKNAYL